jgi:sarcosine oxidase subunit delta
MMRIPCPWCGTRDLAEFRSGGEAGIVRPPDPSAVSDEAWANYLFYRNNTKGMHQERWLHSFGCRQWFVVTRDTVTHEITETHPMSPVAPAAGQPS